MSTPPDRPRSQVVLVDEDEHLPLLADFVRQVWSPKLRLEDLRASRAEAAKRNPAVPGQTPPTFLFLLDGRAVGHLTTIPTRLQCGGWGGPAHWLKGFWVLPEHRNGPIGAMLVREAARHLDCLLATAVEEAPRRVFGAFKMRDLGAFSEHVRLLRPDRVLQRLDPSGFASGSRVAMRAALGLARLPGLSHLGGALLRAALAIRGSTAMGERDLRVETDPQDETGLDALWTRVAAELSCTPVRDAAYLRHVYGRSPGTVHRVVVLKRGGEPVAWASVRRPRDGAGDPRLRGIRMATLSEVVVPVTRPNDALALIREAEAVARDDGADVLLCSASHQMLQRCLSQRAFVSIGGRLHLSARGPKEGPPLPDSLDEWWLTRADGGADEGL